MGKETNIEWCDSTINGCDGCELWNDQVKTCYAGNLQTRRLSKSLPRLYSRDFSEVRMIPGRYAEAASWSDLRGTERPDKPWLNGLPRMIFVGDLGDTFSRAVTDEFLTSELFGAITSKQGQRHFWMLLTKRPRRLAALAKKWGGLPDNVMAMTTVTSQRTACARVADLLDVPCKWKGLSCEPLLAAVNLRAIDDAEGNRLDSLTGAWGVEGRGWTPESANRINLVICGGESGPGAKPMHPDWARSLRDQCAAAGVPFFFKQWGEFRAFDAAECRASLTKNTMISGDLRTGFERVGKKKAGRLLDGREWSEFPCPQIEQMEGRAA